ncbi:MAG: nitroreductase [Bacteroidetes bacterium]|nr:nitroreductase [Bacteroidota bacterium]
MKFDPVSIIPKRTSRRSYISNALTEKNLLEIQSLLGKYSQGPLGTEVEFQLVSKHAPSNRKLKLGTYGFIQGAGQFIVGQVKPTKDAMLDYGFLLEKIVLELTHLNMATCWLGGTFDRSGFGKAINQKEGWVIPAITPVGYSTKNRSIGDTVIRAGAGSKRRKSWEELFFSGETKKPALADEMGNKSLWLEMLRIGPSASNNQPWRIMVFPDKFQLYLNRKPGYQKMFGVVDIQMIDMGIAMSHLDIMMRSEQLEAKWRFENAPEELHDWEYVISLDLC